ncbi:dihydrodipicolinate synthase family protein [Subtercola lobariae]|uniref:Dihydrodipicolinate synthase family protein n=2 Tax=Subtercola lobariae TaxID=1588641 RepID=A0A917BDW0_9MICO|nr:dihydrodipicolinate synthase family protein [Subtercola lobariae]
MDRHSVDWHGYWVAAPTPFGDDGLIDPDLHRAMIEMYIAQGVKGLVVNGSSGEWWAQTLQERKTNAELFVTISGGRIPVIVGCSGFTPDYVVALAQHAQHIGADGVLATAPAYVHPTQQEIFAFFSEIDQRIDLPLSIYNWPLGIGTEIEVSTMLRLAELDHVVSIKNSTGNLVALRQAVVELSPIVRVFANLISPAGIDVIQNYGSDGFIDGGGLGAPFGVPFFEAIDAGDIDRAREVAIKYSTLMTGLWNPDFSGRFAAPVAQLKAAMQMLGQPGGVVRSPLLPLSDPSSTAQLHELLSSVGLLSVE